MLLDDILEELQLTHSSKSNSSPKGSGVHGKGAASLEQLDALVRDHYTNFLGSNLDRTTLILCGDYTKCSRRERLTQGNDSDYGNDESTGDFALACDLLQDGFDPNDVEVIMRATRYRDKFDEMRGQSTYLECTLNKAMASVEQGDNKLPLETPNAFLTRGAISIPATPPPARNYVWQGRIVAGHGYVLGGFGGVSKSQAALQLASSIALGAPFGKINTKKGSALLIFGEDDHGEITRRLGAYAAHENLSSSQRTDIENNIRTLGLVGEDTRLTAMRSGTLVDSGFAAKIIAAATELASQSGEPTLLIVLDHAGLFHGGDFNAREDVSLTMRMVNHIAHETGAAVLMLAHSPKSSSDAESSDASAIAGSTTFVDQTRGAFIIATMRPNEAKALGIPDAIRQQYVSMTVVKNNYGKTGEATWFTRASPPDWEVGVLCPVDLQPPVRCTTLNAGTATRIRHFVAEHPGQYSKSGLRDKRSGKDGELKASKQEVAAAIEDLLDNGELITRVPTHEERKKFDLPQQTKVVLDVPAKVG